MTPLNRCARGPRYSVYVFALAFLSGWPGRVADAQVAPNAGNIPPAHSLVIPGDFSRGPSPDRAVRMRSLLDTVTTTLRRLEVHRTSLPPGASPHAPHRHAHEELMLVVAKQLAAFGHGCHGDANGGAFKQVVAQDRLNIFIEISTPGGRCDGQQRHPQQNRA